MSDEKDVYRTEKEALYKSIEAEIKSKDLILSIMKSFAESPYTSDVNSICDVKDFLEALKLSLDLSNKNIDALNRILKNIDIVTTPSGINNSDEQDTASDNKSDLHIDTTEISDIPVQESKNDSIEDSSLKSDNIENNDVNSESVQAPPLSSVENTLIISVVRNCVILPYRIIELEKVLTQNPEKYSSVNDIIEKEYTIPLSKYKNPFVSRFREAFNLMRKKEKASIKDSFDLSLELMFNYNLNPAIISACKNIDELDIYLDYLDSSEIKKFDIFNIVFEIPPVISKSKSKH